MISQVVCGTMFTSLASTSPIAYKQRVALFKEAGCGSKSRRVVIGCSDAASKYESRYALEANSSSLQRRTLMGAVVGTTFTLAGSNFAPLRAAETEGFVVRRAPSGQTIEDVPGNKFKSNDDRKLIVTRDFLLKYDQTVFTEQPVSDTYQAPSTIGTNPSLLYGNAAPPPNPLQVKLAAEDGRTVSVAFRKGSTVLPTLIQVRDITGYGTPEEVAELVVPPGSTVTGYAANEKLSPSVKGKEGIKRTYYIYKFKRNNEREVGYLCAAARKGQLYVMLAVGDPSIVGREEAFQELKTVVESFTLR